MTSVDDSLVRSLVERVVQEAGQPGGPSLDAIIRREVAHYSEEVLTARGWGGSEEDRLVEDITSSLSGLGPLQEFLDDPDVKEIWINAPHAVFVARLGVSEKAEVWMLIPLVLIILPITVIFAVWPSFQALEFSF